MKEGRPTFHTSDFLQSAIIVSLIPGWVTKHAMKIMTLNFQNSGNSGVVATVFHLTGKYYSTLDAVLILKNNNRREYIKAFPTFT